MYEKLVYKVDFLKSPHVIYIKRLRYELHMIIFSLHSNIVIYLFRSSLYLLDKLNIEHVQKLSVLL